MNNDAAKPTDDQLEEIYELLELLPAEARRTLVGGLRLRPDRRTGDSGHPPAARSR